MSADHTGVLSSKWIERPRRASPIVRMPLSAARSSRGQMIPFAELSLAGREGQSVGIAFDNAHSAKISILKAAMARCKRLLNRRSAFELCVVAGALPDETLLASPVARGACMARAEPRSTFQYGIAAGALRDESAHASPVVRRACVT